MSQSIRRPRASPGSQWEKFTDEVIKQLAETNVFVSNGPYGLVPKGAPVRLDAKLIANAYRSLARSLTRRNSKEQNKRLHEAVRLFVALAREKPDFLADMEETSFMAITETAYRNVSRGKPSDYLFLTSIVGRELTSPVLEKIRNCYEDSDLPRTVLCVPRETPAAPVPIPAGYIDGPNGILFVYRGHEEVKDLDTAYSTARSKAAQYGPDSPDDDLMKWSDYLAILRDIHFGFQRAEEDQRYLSQKYPERPQRWSRLSESNQKTLIYGLS